MADDLSGQAAGPVRAAGQQRGRSSIFLVLRSNREIIVGIFRFAQRLVSG